MQKQTAIESMLVFEELKKALVKDGDICPYERIQAVIDKNPQVEGYPYVVTARRRFEREMECVLEVIPSVGIKRCTPRDVVNRGGKDLKHVRVSTKRAIQRLATQAPIEKQKNLTNEEKSVYLSTISQFGVLNHMMKPSSTKKIMEAANASARVLPSSETLQLFAGKKTDKEKVH